MDNSATTKRIASRSRVTSLPDNGDAIIRSRSAAVLEHLYAERKRLRKEARRLSDARKANALAIEQASTVVATL